MTEYHTLLHFAISSGALTRSCFLGQYLNSLWKDHLAVHSLGAKETYLTVCRIQLVQAFKRTALAVCDPVIREITKSDGLRPGRDGRHISRGFYRPAKDRVRRTGYQGRLLQVLPIIILQLTDGFDGGII